jgi:ATP synthase protein I
LPSSTPPERSTPPEGSGEDWSRAIREAGPYVGLGTTLAVTVLAGLGGGHWIDGRWGTDPLFLILGGSLGVAAALIYFFRTVKGFSKGKAGGEREPR